MSVKYFWNERKHESYEDLLNAICDNIYRKEEIYEESYELGYCKKRYPRKIVIGVEYKLIGYYDLTEFFKKFRHNENDGIYHKEQSRPIFRNGNVHHYQIIPAWFDQKPWIVIDSYGRIINSKDLRLDAINHKYDPYWKAKYRKPHKFRWYGFSYRNGNWQKYLGDHAGPTPDYKKEIHHNNDRKEILDEFGITFKIRGKRTVDLREAADWDGRHGWIEKGWKQSRKKKQWM